MTRQALVLIGSSYYNLTIEAYSSKDLAGFLERSALFLQLLDDLESILKTHRHFLLGPWLESAKSLAGTDAEKALLEYNARIQVYYVRSNNIWSS
jgi:alpha-N-acetylglucosaminidase